MQYKFPWPNIGLLKSMAKCSYCTGFWAGALTYLLYDGLAKLPTLLSGPAGGWLDKGLECLPMALACAIFCHMTDEGIRRIQR
mgnify:FL=1